MSTHACRPCHTVQPGRGSLIRLALLYVPSRRSELVLCTTDPSRESKSENRLRCDRQSYKQAIRETEKTSSVRLMAESVEALSRM